MVLSTEKESAVTKVTALFLFPSLSLPSVLLRGLLFVLVFRALFFQKEKENESGNLTLEQQKLLFMFVNCALYSKKFDKIYIGYTSDLNNLFHSHNALSSKGFMSKFRP
jgi:hypothetical protein